ALLEEAGEDGLAERAATAYTDREQRETADMFRKAFRDRRFIGAGLKPKGPNRCLANALRALLEDPQAVVYLPPKAYKRGGKLTRDPRVIENPHGRTLQVTKMGSHEERRNINVLALKDVKVLPLGPDGKIDPNGRPEQKQIWRWYNIVRGGNRVIQDLCASMSPTLFEEFVAAGIIHGESDTAPGYRPGVTYDCDFRGLPDFSKSWGQATTLLQLVPLLREEQELKAEQKALNARIKDLKAEVPPEQQDPSDIYQPSEKVVEGIPVETYEERCVKYGLMKYKAKDYTDAVAKLVLGAAIMRVKEVRARLLTIRTIGRLIVMAAEATGSKLIPWGEPKVTGYGKTEQLAPYCGAQLKRTTWTETFECS
ncbi:hypothetical protein HY632_04945, partial [Candidatus Uhrbacteria bacterium]|nr:hypothetical protein [Candidatus Uhrbacteria bacterium]